MQGIQLSIVAFVENSYPGWVKAVFTDARGKEWSIIEKAPIVTDEFLDKSSQYPVVGFVAATIVSYSAESDKKIVTIDLSQPWGVSTEDGQEIFDVFEEQVIEI